MVDVWKLSLEKPLGVIFSQRSFIEVSVPKLGKQNTSSVLNTLSIYNRNAQALSTDGIVLKKVFTSSTTSVVNVWKLSMDRPFAVIFLHRNFFEVSVPKLGKQNTSSVLNTLSIYNRNAQALSTDGIVLKKVFASSTTSVVNVWKLSVHMPLGVTFLYRNFIEVSIPKLGKQNT